MADGSTKLIEEVKKGERVLACDPEKSSEVKAYKVTNTLQNHTRRLITVAIDENNDGVADGNVKATAEHPFWTVNRGWVDAKDLKVNDKLTNEELKAVSIIAVCKEKSVCNTFNLTIAGVHTYFVKAGSSFILTHNTCGDAGNVKKTYQVYRKDPINPKTHGVYTGRTSGTRKAATNVDVRDAGHHMNATHKPAKLVASSSNKDAVRGFEQKLIDANGGALSQGGSSGNKINGISDKNPKKQRYMDAAEKEFVVK